MGRDEVVATPEAHLLFHREGVGEDHVVVLVGRSRETKLSFAHVVPYEGTLGERTGSSESPEVWGTRGYGVPNGSAAGLE